MRIILKLTGTSALVMHNPRMVDSQDKYKRMIDEITAKGSKQTDSDREEVGRLEYIGGIYHDPEIGVYVPSWNIVKCINRGAVITKQGSDVLRALSVVSDKVKLLYSGPHEVTKLCEMDEYRLRKEVGIGQKKVIRVRPLFRNWSLEMEAEFQSDVMNLDDLLRVATTAGKSEGLGDARKLGYGRFFAEVHHE